MYLQSVRKYDWNTILNIKNACLHIIGAYVIRVYGQTCNYMPIVTDCQQSLMIVKDVCIFQTILQSIVQPSDALKTKNLFVYMFLRKIIITIFA